MISKEQENSSSANWTKKISNGYNDRQVIRFLLFQIPPINFVMVLIPEIFCQFLGIDARKKTEKVFFQFRCSFWLQAAYYCKFPL